MFYKVQLKYSIIIDGKTKNRNDMILVKAVNYGDAETQVAEYIDKNTDKFSNPLLASVSHFKQELTILREIVEFETDAPNKWWYGRIKYIVDGDGGKPSAFWVHHAIYAENIDEALSMMRIDEKRVVSVAGEVDKLETLKLEFNLIEE